MFLVLVGGLWHIVRQNEIGFEKFGAKVEFECRYWCSSQGTKLEMLRHVPRREHHRILMLYKQRKPFSHTKLLAKLFAIADSSTHLQQFHFDLFELLADFEPFTSHQCQILLYRYRNLNNDDQDVLIDILIWNRAAPAVHMQ